jgi:hypothetical protein
VRVCNTTLATLATLVCREERLAVSSGGSLIAIINQYYNNFCNCFVAVHGFQVIKASPSSSISFLSL